jgi:predicted AlkP superfamily pyrophosphatase or phosphodiesterase
MVTMEEATVVSIGQVITIAPNFGHEGQVAKKLLGAHAQYDCWRKGELPARWHYGTHPRIPPIVCQMHEGWDALPRQVIATRPKYQHRGSHGYDPALPSMRALFVARGPAFRQGVEIPAFDNVDVYPLLARLLGIAPAPNDGDIAPLLPALRDTQD